MQAWRSPVCEPYYPALKGRSLGTTASLVALGGKLARVSFMLLQKNADFDPKMPRNALAEVIESIRTQGQKVVIRKTVSRYAAS
jgi:hypothetical protein